LEALLALGGDVVASASRARFANMRLWDASTGEGVHCGATNGSITALASLDAELFVVCVNTALMYF
jgi:hypothetical protein